MSLFADWSEGNDGKHVPMAHCGAKAVQHFFEERCIL